MKRILVYIASGLCIMTSCIEEQIFTDVAPKPGQEVEFVASVLEAAQTRTVYGADNNYGMNVYWVNGDKISVYGTTCIEGRKQAEYKVELTGEHSAATPNQDRDIVVSEDGTITGTYGGQNFADALTKTQSFGVQWGDATTSDFCAIYPSQGVTFASSNIDANNDGKTAIIAHTSINNVQDYVFTECKKRAFFTTATDGEGVETKTYYDLWQGSHFNSDAKSPSMQNAIMYARTDDVNNGDQANLHFKPFATVLKFRLAGYTAGTGLTNPTIYVQNITITAPDGYAISGDFQLAIEGSGSSAIATATAEGQNSNTITLNTVLERGTYLPLQVGQAVDFNVFMIPVANQQLGGPVYTGTEPMVDAAGNQLKDDQGNTIFKKTCEYPWKVTVTTATHGTFEYTILPNSDQSGNYPTYTLTPGKIHKVKVPNLHVETNINWNPENWIEQIPTPVYVSELSVPGAWYCTNSDYQNTTDIKEQYSKGIRAFNIDCRMTINKTLDCDNFNGYTYSDYTDGDIVLVCAGTEKEHTTLSIANGVMDDFTTVATVLGNIAKEVKPTEYAVVVLTIAEQPKKNSSKVYGTIDPMITLAAINDLINEKGKDFKIYGYTELTKNKTITSNTTIKEVLNHIIIKINANTIATSNTQLPDVTGFSNYANVPNTLISYASMSPETEGQVVSGVFNEMQDAPIYWGKSSSDLTFYFHQAQRTTSNNVETEYPTYEERISAIDEIIKKSSEIYNSKKHNSWFQIGIGGYQLDRDLGMFGDKADQAAVPKVLNPYLYGKIYSKMNTDPSPVGIVLMNHCTDETKYTATVDGNIYSASSQDLVKAIIEMNGKFYLNREGNSVITGGTDDSGSGTTPSQAKNAAYAVVGDDAF